MGTFGKTYGKNLVQIGANWLYLLYRDYRARVTADLGTVTSESNTKAYYQMARSNGISNIRFAWFGEAGIKTRVAGSTSFLSKGYSLFGTNDLVQATDLSQPYISGNIAPTERIGLKNNNGDSRFLTHPAISFAANEAWSVTTVLNSNGDSNSLYKRVCANGASSSLSRIMLHPTLNIIYIGGESNTTVLFNTNKLTVGKNYILTFTTTGSIVSLYIDGVFISSSAYSDNFILNTLFSQQGVNGSIFAHIIQSGALTPTQIAAQSNFLTNLYPEIPTITITDSNGLNPQTWATSNCEMVTTPQGNQIANITANTFVEKIVNGTMEGTYVAGVAPSWIFNRGIASENATTPYAGVSSQNITNPAGNTGVIIQTSVTTVIGQWYKFGFWAKSIAGGGGFFSEYTNSQVSNIFITSSSWTYYSAYFKATGNFSLGFYALTNAVANTNGISFDNVSLQEIGWSKSTELYDAIYAATSGTVEQKTYAGLKAAAMWAYPSNDVAIGSIYGKILNKYAADLLKMDIAYFNTANPTALWGYQVETESDLTYLATNGGNALKKEGTSYSNTAGGTNTKGFTALLAGKRNTDGTFTTLKDNAYFVCADSNKALKLYHNSDVAELVAIDPREGCSVRFVKN